MSINNAKEDLAFQKVTESGDANAIFNLVICYENGEGTEKDLKKAFYWYQKAAESGHLNAMNSLAIFYVNGEGTEKDLEKAFHWYRKAAESGDTEARNILAFFYENGEGTEKDLEKTIHWYQKAAESGHLNAMFNLTICENEKGTEKDLKKAIHWYQKAAESGHLNSMFNLAICYKNGEGTEKNLEKAIYWYQKAAGNDYLNAMFNLAICYKYGEGTEKDLEKAFYWYQKATEGGFVNAMNSLSFCYENGEGTEKDMKKAIHWYQIAAESGHLNAMNSLAICYYNGEGTEEDLEKAFYWYQKAAESGDAEAMNILAFFYENSEGIEKDLEKAFYWYQIAAENGDTSAMNSLAISTENNKISFKIEFCNECKQPYTNYQWCQQCNFKQFQQDFSKWTSKNKYIDKFIQEAQLNAKNSYEVLEWIPYNKLTNINYYDKGGFSKINKAIWLEDPLIVGILIKNNGIDGTFKQITIIVMSYAKKGNLRKCLSSIIRFEWQDKLQLLKKIILGLKVIHGSNLTHGDLHDGNILMSDNHNELFIIDLGLCKPIRDLQTSEEEDNEIYGVVPYIAPEVLRKKPYTPASDIYSFSMIMWEFTSGIPPFNDRAHDYQLIYDICKGERPEIIRNIPKCYVDLMKRCWDSNPSNRPTIIEFEHKISEWIRYISEYYRINRDGNYKYLVPDINNELKNDMNEFVEANNTNLVQEQNIFTTVQSHPQAYYTSRNMTKILVKDDTECLEYIIEV
ncbi:hypothetical protein RclHR1_05510003 [Rhizophagus clarus]|uniref:Protein kinase domain-containing protein n=1 Tax=Rhizophagus clarus TaxID=94130 RepID=A0A2Z6S610_9GLOM|nr:hypothetical protein RclHR1_05510003 [Rhizophagus clarus]